MRRDTASTFIDRLRAAGSILAALFVCLLLTSPPALAGTTTSRPLITSFDGSATPNGAFGLAEDIAFDRASGDLYLLDSSLGLYKLDTAGNPLNFPAIGAPIIDGSTTPRGGLGLSVPRVDVAIDESGGPNDGYIYIANGFPFYPGAPTAVTVFNEDGEYLHSITDTATPLIRPCGLAVDTEGSLYVADGNIGEFGRPSDRIHKFTVSSTGANVVSTISLENRPGVPCDLAIDSDGSLYVNNVDPQSSFGGDVEKFDSTGTFQSVLDPGPANAVAVDPTNNHVFVDHGGSFLDTHGSIIEYNTSGGVVAEFGATKVGESQGIEVDPATDHVFVSDATAGKVHVFGPASTVVIPDVTIATPTPVGFFDATLLGSVDPQGVPTAYHFEYRPKGQPKWTSTPEEDAGSGTGDAPASAEIADLNHKSTYEVRLVAVNTDAGTPVRSDIRTFVTKTVPPPTLEPPSVVTDTSAHLSGTVNPQGLETTWRFEYSTDHVNWTSVPGGAAAGTSNVAVEADLADIEPNVQYFVRLVAENAGSVTTSTEQAFKTASIAPTAETRGAFPVFSSSAQLRATIDPNNAPTSYYFELGPDASYGSQIPIPVGNAGSGGAPTPVYSMAEGLQPDTTYHYRVVAESSAGTTAGNDVTFTTRAVGDDPSLPVRHVELVTPPDKATQNLVHPYLASGGDHVIWDTRTGAPGSNTGQLAQFVANRTSTGWLSRTYAPPASVAVGGGNLGYTLVATTPDFSAGIFLVGETGSGKTSYVVRINADGGEEVLSGEEPGAVAGINVWRPRVEASADLSHVLIGTAIKHDPSQPDNVGQVYDVGDGTPELVSRMPDGSIPTCGVRGGSYENLSGFASAFIPYKYLSTDPSVGLKAFFQSQGNGSSCFPYPDAAGLPGYDSEHVYRRDLEAGITERLAPPPVSGPELSDGYVRSTPDGARALIISRANLDPDGDDTDPDLNDGLDSDESNDIYEWREGEGVSCLTCLAPVEANVRGSWTGDYPGVVASNHFERVYFTSSQQLVPGKGDPDPAVVKLYVIHDGEIDYISPLEGNFLPSLWGSDGGTTSTPDGRVFVFMISAQGVTQDDPGKCALSASQPASACSQFYRYDDGDGSLECLTCPPKGAQYAQPAFDEGVDTAEAGLNTSLALQTPLTEDGETFIFTSMRPFVPEDVNRSRDIYEWHDGIYRLITDGVTEYGNDLANRPRIIGISANGTDLVFRLNARLTGYEIEDAPQLFNARIGGGFGPPPSPPAPCVEDACQGPLVAAPPVAPAGSTEFSGPGNSQTAKARRGCGKGQRRIKVRGKTRCVRRQQHKRSSAGRNLRHRNGGQR